MAGTGIERGGGTGIGGTGISRGTGIGKAGGAYVLPASSQKPKKKPRWGAAFLSNLEEFAHGVIPGVKALGAAAYNDVDKIAGDVLPFHKAGAFRSDDIAKAIGVDYKTRYGPLFKGEWGKFRDQVAERPLDFILDAATIATAGSGAAITAPAKGIVAGAKGAVKAGSVADKVTKWAGYVARTPENVAAAERVYGAASKQVRQGEAAGLVRGVRTIGKGRASETQIPLKQNAALRGRDALVDKVIGAEKFDNVPLVGLNARNARQERRMPAIHADVNKERLLAEAARKTNRLSRDEREGWWFLHEKVKPTEYVAMLERTLETDTKLSDHDQRVLAATIEDLSRPEFQDLVANPTRKMQEAVAATRQLGDDMRVFVRRLTGMTDEQLDDRVLLTQRKLAGGQAVEAHPERVKAREGAIQRVSQGAGVPLRDGPGGPERSGERIRPSREQVDEMLTKAERQLLAGEYARQSKQMKVWLARFWDQYVHGSDAPDTATRRAFNAKNQAARARAKRRGRAGEVPGLVQLTRIVERVGAFSRQAARLVDDAGPAKSSLAKALRNERKADERFISQWPEGSLERRLAEAGIHPTDSLANVPDDVGVVAHVLWEFLEDRTGGVSVAEVADGVRNERVQIDQEDAQALVQEARRLDDELPENPSNDDVAAALAERYVPFDEVRDVVPREEWVRRAHDAIMRVYVDRIDDVNVDAELPKIRGPIARAMADNLGIRDPQLGIEPGGREWAQAFAAAAQRAGFDDAYRAKAKAVKEARARFEAEGPDVFTGEVVPVPLKELPGYRDAELLNPETGRLYRDELAAMTPEERAAALEEAGGYTPHKVAVSGSRMGGTITDRGATAGAPKLDMKASIGRRLETGNFSRDPVMLLREAERVVRAQHMSDLYDVMATRGAKTPFDRDVYRNTGGDRSWMVLDPKGIKGLGRRLQEQSAMMRELEEFLPTEQFDNVSQRIETLTDEVLAPGGNTDGLVMVPRAYYERMLADMRQSSAFMRAVVDRPLDVFRTLVLFTRPAYYANNIVSQHLMLAMKAGPHMLPAYVRFLAGRAGGLPGARQVFRQVLEDGEISGGLWDEFLDTHAAGVKGASAHDVMVPRGDAGIRQRLNMRGTRKARATAWLLSAPENLNRFGAILSDDLPRQFRFVQLTMPHVKAARAAGMKGDDATIAMRILDEDPVLADQITMQVLDDLIDYRGMSSAERLGVRRVIPFYGWMRGITKWMTDLGYNHPDQLFALAQVSNVGQRENAEWNAATPGWMHGQVLLGSEKDGVQRVLNTQGFNPVGTLAELTMMGRAAVSDEPGRSLAVGTTLGQINPYAQTVLAAMFNGGKQLGSPFPMLMPGQTMNAPAGTQRQWPGWYGTAIGGFIASTPQATLYAQRKAQGINEATANRSVVNATGVYQSPWSDYVKSYLGLPVRNVSVAGAADRLARDEAVLAGEGRSF